MSLMVKTFWTFIVGILLLGIIFFGFIGIPAKPVTILKSIPNDQLPQ